MIEAIMKFIFFLSIMLILYTYLGYPVIILILSKLFPKDNKYSKDIEALPKVSLLIAAYNEEKVIKEKIENSLSLDYPKDKIEIVIVSDGSKDRTDEIVKSYSDKNVRLVRIEKNRGKTNALNEGIKHCKGDIVVLSDANSMYKNNALRHLVKYFSSPEIGVVCGELKYINPEKSASGKSEGLYWRYEVFIKGVESNFNTLIGANGSIYAIRRNEFVPIPTDLMDDLMEPIFIYVKHNRRAIYEPLAMTFEEPAESFEKEFKRKVRIVSSALYSLMRTTGFWLKKPTFAFQVLSHKIIRWFVPYILILTFFSNLAIILIGGKGKIAYYWFLFICQIIFYLLAIIGHKQNKKGKSNRFIGVIYYFCVVNVASLLGILEYLLGKKYITWETCRVDNHQELKK